MERRELESREKEKNIQRERKKGIPVGFKCNLSNGPDKKERTKTQ